MIRKILWALGVLVVLVIGAVVAAIVLAPTDYRVEREITINRPAPEIYAYARNLKNQNDWGPWFKKEPTMKQEFRGTDGEIGFVSHWTGDSEEVGEGEQEIKRLVPDQRIDTELRFLRPFEAKADAHMLLEPAGSSHTKVRWGINGAMPRPFNAMGLFLDFDTLMGKDLDEGLSGLKSIMESR
jgi:hypothetical protein